MTAAEMGERGATKLMLPRRHLRSKAKRARNPEAGRQHGRFTEAPLQTSFLARRFDLDIHHDLVTDH